MNRPADPSKEYAGDEPLSIGTCVTLACIFEATAAKPGNVYRGADFDDLTYTDFLTSAALIGPILARGDEQRLGGSILRAVRATRQATGTNVNLGIVLLLAPLARVPRDVPLASGVRAVLAGLDRRDAHDVYAAIRLAQAGGLGTAPQADISQPPDRDLVSAMRLAQQRDRVARQYARDFEDVLDRIVPWIRSDCQHPWPLADIIVRGYLRVMAEFPDSLIARKCGAPLAQQAAHRAAEVLSAGKPGEQAYEEALADFDFWLRADGHRRNPGTSADLLTAGLFVALRDGIIEQPFRFYRGQ